MTWVCRIIKNVKVKCQNISFALEDTGSIPANFGLCEANQLQYTFPYLGYF